MPKKKKKENLIYNENLSIIVDSEITYMLELVDKDIKLLIIIIFHISKKLKER